MIDSAAKKSGVTGAPISAILIGLGVFLSACERPGSKFHSLDTGIVCLESSDMEKAIGIVRDTLLKRIPEYVQLREGYPAVEVFDKDLWPVSVDTADERRSSYRFTLDEDGSVIELFYRRESEAEARFWPGFTIYVLSDCRRERIDPTHGRRVVVFTSGSDSYRVVEHILRTEIGR